MVGNPRREYSVQCCEQQALLRMQRRSVVDGTSGRLSHAAFSDVQAGFGVGRQRAQGRARHEGVFREATTGRDKGDDSSSTRLIPMMREYTVFNVDQC